MQICRSWLGDPAVSTCLCILACSNRLVTFIHVLGTVAKLIGGGIVALQPKERQKSEKVSIPPFVLTLLAFAMYQVTFRILDSYMTRLPQVLVPGQPLHAVRRWAHSQLPSLRQP